MDAKTPLILFVGELERFQLFLLKAKVLMVKLKK
jgi:hypothetical protein